MRCENSVQPWARKRALIGQSGYAKAAGVTAMVSTAARLAAANIEAASICHDANGSDTLDRIQLISRFPASQCISSRFPAAGRQPKRGPRSRQPHLLDPRDGNGPKPCAHRSVADRSNLDRSSPCSGNTTRGHPHLCR
jgi:hypothetical protein